MRPGYSWIVAAALSVTGCKSEAPRREQRADGKEPRALSVLRAIPAFASQLREAPAPVVAAGAFELAPGALVTTLSNGEAADVRLELSGSPRFWMELRAEAVAPRKATVRGSALIRAEAGLDTDIVQIAGPTRMEEFRIIYSARAPQAAVWRVLRGPDVARIEIVNGVVQAMDRDGRVRVVSEPAYAIDAIGKTIPVQLSLADADGAVRLTATWSSTDVVFPLAVDPAWVSVATTAARRRASATLLTSGKLLVAGGNNAGGAPLSSAVLYDPIAGTWTATGSLAGPRTNHAAVRLPSGNVLVAGGDDNSTFSGVSTAEIYNPTTGTWSSAQAMTRRRPYALAALVGSKVLVAGSSALDAETYDPGSNTWTLTGPMASPHIYGGIAAVGSRALVVAGIDSASTRLSVAEVYDLGTNTWSSAGNLSYGTGLVHIAALDTGKILVAGGSAAVGGVSGAETFDPATKTWSPAAPTVGKHDFGVMFPLTGGRAVLYSQLTFPTTEVYDATTNKWFTASSPPVDFQNVLAGPLSGSKMMLIAGDSATGFIAAPEIFTLQSLGGTCAKPGDCASFTCVDGVCCDTTCTGTCQACDVAGKVGTCSSVTGDPHGSRSCGSYACAAGVCKSSCTGNSDCQSGAYCSGSVCVGKRANGLGCAAASDCASGFCVDGVCCNTACTGQCAACDNAGSVGTCSPAGGAPHGTRPACTGVGIGSTCGPGCNGVDTATCHFPGTSTPCSANVCTAGKETHASTCDGAGTCQDKPKDCGVYACSATTCKTTCSAKSDCAPGYYCSGSACVPSASLGTACTDASTCGAGLFCTDGFCCGVPGCDAGSSCGGATRKGSCTKTNGVACDLATECGSGLCVDRVCCDRACEGQCEACDVFGKAGTCAPVSGAPHGTRTRCDDGAGDACKALQCNGASDPTKCVAFAAGGSVTCAAAACAGTSFTGKSSCDGKGGCQAPAPTSCVPYTCDATGCLTACADNTQCADGFECREARCITKGAAVCSADGKSSIPSGAVPVPCAPYVCGSDGKCKNACDGTPDCALGFVCDVTTRSCVLGEAPQEDAGGCSMQRPSGMKMTWPVSLLFIALGTALRRRRAAALVASLGVAGCGVRGNANDNADAANPAPLVASHAADVRQTIAPIAAIESKLRASRPLLALEGALRPKIDGPHTLDVTIPRDAGGPLRVGTRERSEAWIEMRAVDTHRVALSADGALAVAHDALPATDVAFFAGGDFVEELRILRGSAAPMVARWSLRHGASIANVRVRDARIEALDASGRLLIGTPPVVAIDARGIERTASVSITRDDGGYTLVATLDPADLTFPITLDPAWSNTGAPVSIPQDTTLSLLPSGKVLRAAGYKAGIVSTAELYDPTSNTWSTVGSLSAARYRHAATVLASGKVLVAGGAGLTTAEVFDPSSNTWSPAGPMTAGRDSVRAVTLTGGKALVVSNGSSELYDPASNAFGTFRSLAAGHCSGTLTALPSGKALVAGGVCPIATPATDVAELFDPASGTWSATGGMLGARTHSAAALLSSGKVLVAGGENYNATDGYVPLTSAELYDPTAGTWSAAGAMSVARNYITMAATGNGRVLAIGDGSNKVDLYDPPTNSWRPVTDAPGSAYRPNSSRLSDGSVLVFNTFFSSWRFQPMTNGTACTVAADCASGLCVDGVCCNAACTGQCSACDVSTALGTCTAVTGVPHGTRTCGAYACNAGTCATSCTTSANCATGRYCAGSACVPKKALGATCGGNVECSSSFCVDGVCCNTSCAGQCSACDVFGKLGTCSAVSGAPHGARTACSGVGVGTTCGIACDGSDVAACHYPGAGVGCSSNACTAGFETHANSCNGSGACNDTPKSCGAFACGPTTCKTSCSVAGDCAAGYFCSTGVCTPTAGLGDPCTSASGCASSLFCTDGVCCGVASCGAGKSCNAGTKKGVCAKTQGTACTANAECASNFCVDGACCDAACDGQCEACDVTGKVGTCTPISGDPHGGRTKCDDGAGDACKARTCDGTKDTKTCASFVGGTATTCAPAQCSGSTLVPASTCDGAGACVAPSSVSCVPYACVGKGCLASCVTPTDCAAGFECRGGTCVAPQKATCEQDGASSRAPDGTVTPCGAYRCGTDGQCQLACGTSSDCASGYSCDPSSKQCVSGGASDDAGGCAAGRSDTTSVAAAALLLAVLGTVRRRRSRTGAPPIT